jgi:hypothetical protein
MIQSASDFFNYCENHLKDTKSTYCKRRIFRYVEKIDRNNISFKAVPGIRRLHQVVSTKSNNNTLAVRNMSCYTCENCITGNYNNCKNNAIGGRVTIPISIDNNRNSRSVKGRKTTSMKWRTLSRKELFLRCTRMNRIPIIIYLGQVHVLKFSRKTLPMTGV